METSSKPAKDLAKIKAKNQEKDMEAIKDLELFKNNMADRLKDSIFKKYLSIADFARKCNLPYDTVRKYVNKERLISSNNIVTMATELGVSCDYLLGVTNEVPAQGGLSINETMQKETNLTSNAISILISHKNDSNYINCVNTLLEEKTILDKFLKYSIFLQNRGIDKWNAKDKDAYKKYENIVHSTETELEKLPEHEYLPMGETLNLGNLYLYQLMQEFENAMERKIQKNRY